MKKNFILGCNYWASHAGTEMWRNWDVNVVKKDFKVLSENGMSYLRVFPNWRDFQPVKPLFSSQGKFYEYCMEGDYHPDNPYFLNEIMLKRFEALCDIAQEYNLKLIVGLLTGWMSGRLFVPSALYGKNLFTDPEALLFEQKFCKGFVGQLKHHKAIYAWDLGNECNCMSSVEKTEVAATWTAIISNAIRANDHTRPIVSGMHSLTIDGAWTIKDQAENTDILTTHPYPYWVKHCSIDKIGSIRTMLHATAETKYYSSIGGKPCLVEELGTMGPMVCNDKIAADFMRVNLFSNWANGATGVMWWCAHDQNELPTAPYSWNMCERELGMLDNFHNPKPMLTEMKKFSQFLNEINFDLPQPKINAVCILSKGQDHWGIAYITYVLAKQAGLNIEFCYSEGQIPEADIYLLPSITGHLVMSKAKYDFLKKKVENGATLYISNNGGFLTEFEEFTGLQVIDSEISNENRKMLMGNINLAFYRERTHTLLPTRANVTAYDDLGLPCFSYSDYGKGQVHYLNFPLEHMLLKENQAFHNDYYQIYKESIATKISGAIIETRNPLVTATQHQTSDGAIAVIINYAKVPQADCFCIKGGYKVSEVYYGDEKNILPFDACVLKIVKI